VLPSVIHSVFNDDEETLEIIAHVAMTFSSNVLNNVSNPEIDLPDLPVPI